MKDCKVKYQENVYADVVEELGQDHVMIRIRVLDGYMDKKVHKDELIVIGHGNNKN
jgi:hypothetical protein